MTFARRCSQRLWHDSVAGHTSKSQHIHSHSDTHTHGRTRCVLTEQLNAVISDRIQQQTCWLQSLQCCCCCCSLYLYQISVDCLHIFFFSQVFGFSHGTDWLVYPSERLSFGILSGYNQSFDIFHSRSTILSCLSVLYLNRSKCSNHC